MFTFEFGNTASLQELRNLIINEVKSCESGATVYLPIDLPAVVSEKRRSDDGVYILQGTFTKSGSDDTACEASSETTDITMTKLRSQLHESIKLSNDYSTESDGQSKGLSFSYHIQILFFFPFDVMLPY